MGDVQEERTTREGYLSMFLKLLGECAALSAKRSFFFVAMLGVMGCSDGSPDPAPQAQGGTSGTNNGVYDEAEAIAACDSACTAYSSACSSTCTPSCDASTRLSSAEVCPAEYNDYYDCVAAQSADAFACDSGDTSNANPVSACATQWTAYSQCKRTRGYDCAILAHDDATCLQATGYPDWVTCTVDKTPPRECAPLNATDYCCG